LSVDNIVIITAWVHC